MVKYKPDGSIDRFKARLVAKGFLQRHGVDYDEIFSPVLRMETLRMLLTIAAVLDLEIHQMDVKTAFLNGSLEEEIYMNQPDGFVVKGSERLVCKLNRLETSTSCLVHNDHDVPGRSRFQTADQRSVRICALEQQLPLHQRVRG